MTPVYFLILKKKKKTFNKHISDEINSTKRERESKRENRRNLICHENFRRLFCLILKVLGICMKTQTLIKHTKINTNQGKSIQFNK